MGLDDFIDSSFFTVFPVFRERGAVVFEGAQAWRIGRQEEKRRAGLFDHASRFRFASAIPHKIDHSFA